MDSSFTTHSGPCAESIFVLNLPDRAERPNGAAAAGDAWAAARQQALRHLPSI